MRVLALILTLAIAPFSAAAGNLVVNGGFEYGLGPTAEGWTAVPGAGAFARAGILPAAQGAYVAQLAGLPSDGPIARSASFEVVEGGKLTLRVAVKDSATPIDAGLEFATPKGPVRAMVGDRGQAQAWTTLTTSTIVPEGATGASVIFLARGETASVADAVEVGLG